MTGVVITVSVGITAVLIVSVVFFDNASTMAANGCVLIVGEPMSSAAAHFDGHSRGGIAAVFIKAAMVVYRAANDNGLMTCFVDTEAGALAGWCEFSNGSHWASLAAAYL